MCRRTSANDTRERDLRHAPNKVEVERRDLTGRRQRKPWRWYTVDESSGVGARSGLTPRPNRDRDVADPIAFMEVTAGRAHVVLTPSGEGVVRMESAGPSRWSILRALRVLGSTDLTRTQAAAAVGEMAIAEGPPASCSLRRLMVSIILRSMMKCAGSRSR